MSAQPAVTEYDPFESATNAQMPALAYYALVQCDAWPCVLVKGTGKVAFNPQQHKIEERRTAIDLSLAPIAEQQVQFPLIRSMIAESPAWIKIVWPSAHALGLKSSRELNGKWAKVEIVPSGRKYTNKSGEEKDETTFKFAAFYSDEATARAAYLGTAGAQAPLETPAAAPAAANGKERETALQFLKVLVPKWAKGTLDTTEVSKGIAANPLIAKYFTAESPEVIEAMAAQAK